MIELPNFKKEPSGLIAETINLHSVSYSLKALLEQSSTNNSVAPVIMSNVFDM